MKFNNQFFVTVNYFVNGILYRHNFGYKQSWWKAKLAFVLTWFGLTYTERAIDNEEYEEHEEHEDPWTEDLAVHLVKLSNGQNLPILCGSISEAWDRMESYLFENNDFQTSIIEVTRDEW
ncbi:hypothetical protein QT972_09765 [Microcoleus sp. herbarium7]|uniref:hypothetical protein n=1 Tax=Microcoleus sp. herbarium7 TaxID=3055435 RepID=UPI002FCF9E0E